jgi:hypothetical protein
MTNCFGPDTIIFVLFYFILFYFILQSLWNKWQVIPTEQNTPLRTVTLTIYTEYI